ncbi:hypothetical protein [Nocardia sp. NPDC047648]|uniref:hypothetical protein n=1 Tax=Nocardia sp. NPDC047648 TaxID=3155625 RepID=UPI0033D40719
MTPTLKLRARSKASRAQARRGDERSARLIHCDDLDLDLGTVHAGERADALSEVPVQVAAVGELEERRMRVTPWSSRRSARQPAAAMRGVTSLLGPDHPQ